LLSNRVLPVVVLLSQLAHFPVLNQLGTLRTSVSVPENTGQLLMGKQKQSDLCESLLGFTGFLSTCEKALTKHGLGFRFDLRYKLCVFSRFAYANWTGEESVAQGG